MQIKSSKKQFRTAKAFTLIELLVVCPCFSSDSAEPIKV